MTGLTLTRFYSIHTLVLPLTVGLFVGVHLFLLHEQGLAEPPGSADQEDK